MIVCLLFLSLDVLLPEDVASVSRIVHTSKGLYIADTRGQAIWHLPKDGEPVIVYDRQGPGPGEFGHLNGFGRVGDQFVVSDFKHNKFIFLDGDFNFIREIKNKTLPRGALMHEDRLYLMYPDLPEGLIHWVNQEGHVEKSFGSVIDTENTLGFETGRALSQDGKIWFIHGFVPLIEAYDPDGNRLLKKVLPGFELEPLVQAKAIDRSVSIHFEYHLSDLVYTGGKFLVKLEHQEEEKAWFYIFNPSTSSFTKRIEAPLRTVSDGRMLLSVEEEDTSGRFRVKTVTFEGEGF